MADLQALMTALQQRIGPHPDGAHLPAHHEQCLGCGVDNPHGHHLSVHREGDLVVATHIFDDRHVGAPGIAHGGAVATVLDDLYGFLLYLVGEPAVTRQLVVEYLAPVLIGTTYRLEARVDRREGRKLFVNAKVTALDGRTAATSTAVFVTVDAEHFAQARPSSAI
ncbi:acyl-coenzyme A thioesterase PaaI-like protein [Nocardioides albertanoniae]|uniref:Acyl-coenzyme A thioesterase THEM4 n=2 Tax=Nocardioidaceae TaxID=85015 RepID=A0A543AD05_9ACTN|nr:acyl-coenzyme A thioesterase PaaI-like protein [Nocardioides albertanoniae]